MKPALIASAAECSSPSERWLWTGSGASPPSALDAVEDARGQALDLNRALDVVLDRFARPVGRYGHGRRDCEAGDDRADRQPRRGLAPPAPPEEPRGGDRRRGEREELQRAADAEQEKADARAARRHAREAGDQAQDRRQVEVRPDHRAGRERCERDHQQGDPLAAAAERGEPSGREQDAHGEHERQHRERVPVGLGVERDAGPAPRSAARRAAGTRSRCRDRARRRRGTRRRRRGRAGRR